MEYHPIYYQGCRHLCENRLSYDLCNARNTCYTSGFTNDQKDIIMSIEEFKSPPEEEHLVPLQKVMEDMDNPDGGMVSIAAKDYYMLHYASDEEREANEKHKESLIKIFIPLLIVIALCILVKCIF